MYVSFITIAFSSIIYLFLAFSLKSLSCQRSQINAFGEYLFQEEEYCEMKDYCLKIIPIVAKMSRYA